MLYKTSCLVNILEIVFVCTEILFKMLLFKGGVLIHAEHCITTFFLQKGPLFLRTYFIPDKSQNMMMLKCG